MTIQTSRVDTLTIQTVHNDILSTSSAIVSAAAIGGIVAAIVVLILFVIIGIVVYRTHRHKQALPVSVELQRKSKGLVGSI